MTWLEKSWYNNGKISYVFAPLSLIFLFISSFRRLLFRFGIKKQNQFSVPVIVVGNISVGGTGKTPFVIYLVNLLRQQGYTPAIVSRGYGAAKDKKRPFPRLVTQYSNVKYSGDEPKLLAMRTDCPVIIDANRSAAVNFAIKHTKCDIVISDDGLQHYAMSRDIEIVLLDKRRMFGNSWLLPVGPLRELPSRLKQVDLVLENGGFSSDNNVRSQESDSEEGYTLTAQNVMNVFDPTIEFDEACHVHLISGIGNPQRFLDTVEGLGISVKSTHWLPDHHQFTLTDFEPFNSQDLVLMTEKDAVKCRALINANAMANEITEKNWFVLPIEAKISESVELKLISLLTRIK